LTVRTRAFIHLINNGKGVKGPLARGIKRRMKRNVPPSGKVRYPFQYLQGKEESKAPPPSF